MCLFIKFEGIYNENSDVRPINPYGNTKATVENILKDLYESSPNSWKVINLRYFNPIGAHPSGKICEDKGKPNNIFPLILKVASSELDCLKIFGNNWDTNDGTGSRDYVHVMDIAEGHLMALNYLLKKSHLFLNLNLGTGVGTTVLELIKAFEYANDLKLKYIFSERREGDISKSIADNTLAIELLGWRPKRNLIDMCKDGWKVK